MRLEISENYCSGKYGSFFWGLFNGDSFKCIWGNEKNVCSYKPVLNVYVCVCEYMCVYIYI